jgi:adenine-specific DNA-methyltransferase
MIENELILFPSDPSGVPRQKKFFDSYTNENKAIVSSLGWYSTEAGTKSLLDLFDGKKVFDNSKPIKLMNYVVNQATVSGDIVLDFFAGSGTTAHAVMAQNAVDGGNRQYILVQFPEPLEPKDNNQKTAADFCDSISKPRTIAEITKERVRRAADKIRRENPLFAGDLGFRSFKLAASHIKPLPQRTHADIASASVDMFAERLFPGWTVDGLCTEVLLREGFPLTTSYTVVHGWRVYESPDVGFPLLLNFADPIGSVDALCAHLADQTGSRGVNKRHGIAVCLDKALSTSERLKLAEYVTLKTI